MKAFQNNPSASLAHLQHYFALQVWEENCRGRGPEREEQCPELNMVWLDCNGEDDPDKENIGSISYTPWRGFPGNVLTKQLFQIQFNFNSNMFYINRFLS